MDFYNIVKEEDILKGYSKNPYSAKKTNGEWLKGFISIDFLNEHFSQFETVGEMKKATESEGLKMYFDWLKEQSILN